MNFKKKWVLAGLLISVISLSSFVHKYYVCKTLVHYDQQASTFEITTQIFIDDLELALSEINNEKPYLKEQNEHEDAEIWVEKYLKDKLKLIVNSAEIELKYLGSELEDDVLYCYLENTNVISVNSFEIRNEILMETFESQKNIIDIEFPSFEKRIILFKEKPFDIVR